MVACLEEILKFSALRLNYVAILTYHLTGCPSLLAINKVYHFSKNLIKVYLVYLVYLRIPSIRALDSSHHIIMSPAMHATTISYYLYN